MKTKLLLAVLAAAALIANAQKLPVDQWSYRVVTDGQKFKVQFKWTSLYWGDEFIWPLNEFTNRAGADLAASVKQKEMEERAAEKASKSWIPVRPMNPALTNLNAADIIVVDSISTNHPASVTEILALLKRETNYDAVLIQLATSGEICRVRGHAWAQHFDKFEQFAVVRPDGYQERVCSVCGKFESRSMQPWPTLNPVATNRLP